MLTYHVYSLLPFRFGGGEGAIDFAGMAVLTLLVMVCGGVFGVLDRVPLGVGPRGDPSHVFVLASPLLFSYVTVCCETRDSGLFHTVSYRAHNAIRAPAIHCYQSSMKGLGVHIREGCNTTILIRSGSS